MATFCNLPYQAVGPNSQTLFLGASVVNFSLNLGWGGESSSCTVKLVKDYSHHPNSSNSFKEYDNHIRYLNSLEKNNQQSRSRAFDAADLKSPQDQQDPKFLHSNLIMKEIEKWDKSIYEDRVTLQPYGIKDLGKKCWPSYINQSNGAFPLNWLNPDPGFIGDPRNFAANSSFDIIGCPVFFRYEDIWFGGMIKNWKQTKNQYEVQLNSLASLLKGSQMVLQKYYGTVTTTIPNTNTALVTDQNLSVPYGDVGLATNPNHPYYNPAAFSSSPYQGNIPNFFNVFGYAENVYGFGSTGYVQGKGVSAGLVYDAVVELLSGLNGIRNQNQWSPYGAIVGKTPMDRSQNQMIDPARIYFEFNRSRLSGDGAQENQKIYLADFGLVAAPAAVDNLPRSLFRLDLSEVPRPPNGVYLSQDTMDILTFVDYCCSNAGCDFYVDFLPDVQPSYFSGSIKIRVVSRKVQAYPDLVKDFLSNLDPASAEKVVDYHFGEEFNDVKSRSVLIGGPQQRLHQVTSHTYGVFRHNKIWEPDIGSFVDMNGITEANQIAGNNLFNTYREPDYANQRGFQFENGPWIGRIEGAVVAQVENEFFTSLQNSYAQMVITKGNYLRNYKPSLNSGAPGVVGQDSYPIYLDCISPYFGIGSDNQVRKVYLDRMQRQLQVVFDFRDIQPYFPTSYDINDGSWSAQNQYINTFLALTSKPNINGKSPYESSVSDVADGGTVGYGKFVVTEAELRMTLANTSASGDDVLGEAVQWWTYTQVRAGFGYPTAIGKILYDYWARSVNEVFAKSMLVDDGPGYITWKSYMGYISRYYAGLRGFRYRDRNRMNAAQFEKLRSDAAQLIKSVYYFLKNVASSHYGKTFAVRLPNIYTYIDASGKNVYNYEIADAAWEEPGNTIDDTIQVGSSIGTTLQTNDGRWPAILAFDNSAEYLHMPYEDSQVFYNKNFYKVGYNTYWYPTPAYQDPWTSKTVSFIKNSFGLTRNRYYYPLKHNLQTSVLLPYATFNNDFVFPGMENVYSPIPSSKTAHGFPVKSDLRYKLYTKANIESVNKFQDTNSQIIFVDGTPRVVFSTDSPVFISTNDKAFSQETFLKYGQIPADGDETPKDIRVVEEMFIPIAVGASQILRNILATKYYINELYMPDQDLSSQRAAMPVFAAIPIKNNLMTYGPWASHPGVIKDSIFPTFASDDNSGIAFVNNLVGGVNVQIDEGLVPWEYGGMGPLDQAAMLRVADDNAYQQVLEFGSLTLAGVMLRNTSIGQRLLGPLSPVVTSVNVSIGNNGVTTQYEMKTFSKKIGLYNKEQADNIQKLNRELVSQNQKLSARIADVLNKAASYTKQPTYINTWGN